MAIALFSQMTNDRIKQPQVLLGRFKLDIRKNFFTERAANVLKAQAQAPQAVEELLILQVFKKMCGWSTWDHGLVMDLVVLINGWT